jgi:hypothetical protein
MSPREVGWGIGKCPFRDFHSFALCYMPNHGSLICSNMKPTYFNLRKITADFDKIIVKWVKNVKIHVETLQGCRVVILSNKKKTAGRFTTSQRACNTENKNVNNVNDIHVTYKTVNDLNQRKNVSCLNKLSFHDLPYKHWPCEASDDLKVATPAGVGYACMPGLRPGLPGPGQVLAGFEHMCINSFRFYAHTKFPSLSS